MLIWISTWCFSHHRRNGITSFCEFQFFSLVVNVESTTLLFTLCALIATCILREEKKGNYTHNCFRVWVKEHYSNTTAKLKSTKKQQTTPAGTNEIKCVWVFCLNKCNFNCAKITGGFLNNFRFIQFFVFQLIFCYFTSIERNFYRYIYNLVIDKKMTVNDISEWMK